MMIQYRFIELLEVHGRASGVPAVSLGVHLGIADGLKWLQMAPEGPGWCQIVPDHGTCVSDFDSSEFKDHAMHSIII